jgi:hypothetical protein
MLTVGKVYGGILIHDNWKKTKFGQIEELRRQEEELEAMEKAFAEEDRKKRRQEAVDNGEDMEEWDRREAEEQGWREIQLFMEGIQASGQTCIWSESQGGRGGLM